MDVKVCRLCCLKNGTKYIFDSDDEIMVSAKILYFCVNINIAEGDGMPEYICKQCDEELGVSYQFVLKCEAADKKLRAETANHLSNQFNDNIDIKEEKQNNLPDFYDDINDTDSDDLKYSIDTPDNLDIKYENGDNLGIKLSKKRSGKRKRQQKIEDFTCPECGRHCKRQSTLQVHMRIHSNEKPFACSTCDKRYKDNGSLKRHIDRNHMKDLRERRFICENCGKKFFSKNDVKIHMRTHTGETPYACPVCPMKFSQQSTLIRHERRHTGEKPYLCSTCSKKFSSRDELKNHLLVHTEEKNYSCPICNGMFKYKSNLKKHIRLHSEQKRFVCNFCGHKFSAKGNLKMHIDSQHSERSGMCNICMKSVPNLEVHMRKHTGERPLKCELCSSTFFEPNGLAHHINFRHKNKNKYKCSYEGCNETFPSHPMLDFHEAKHHGNHIPFPCDQCPRGFYRKNDLARHKIGTHKERLKT